MQRFLQQTSNHANFTSLASITHTYQNIDEEWLKQSENRYKLVKSSYEHDKTVRKILVPRKSKACL